MPFQIVVSEREQDFRIQTPDSFTMASRETVVDAAANLIQQATLAGRTVELTTPDWIRAELSARGFNGHTQPGASLPIITMRKLLEPP